MVKNRGSKRTLTPKDTFLRRVRHVQRRGHRRGIHRSIAEIIQEIAAAVWVPAILPDGLEFELDLSSAPANSAVIDAVSSATSSAPSSAAVDASTDQQGTRSETGLSGLQLQDEFCELLRILPHLSRHLGRRMSRRLGGSEMKVCSSRKYDPPANMTPQRKAIMLERCRASLSFLFDQGPESC